MKIRWMILFFPVVSVVAVSLLVKEHAANAPVPQGAAAAVTAASVASAASNSSGAAAIPDTTLAINSARPMSQRVVHYEIDAKYDAGKHIVDASERLTYHNLTGQALDHFPCHRDQNAFQPKSTWVREAKIEGSRDTAYDKWEEKEYGSEDIKSLEVVGQGDGEEGEVIGDQPAQPEGGEGAGGAGSGGGEGHDLESTAYDIG